MKNLRCGHAGHVGHARHAGYAGQRYTRDTRHIRQGRESKSRSLNSLSLFPLQWRQFMRIPRHVVYIFNINCCSAGGSGSKGSLPMVIDSLSGFLSEKQVICSNFMWCNIIRCTMVHVDDHSCLGYIRRSKNQQVLMTVKAIMSDKSKNHLFLYVFG